MNAIQFISSLQTYIHVYIYIYASGEDALEQMAHVGRVLAQSVIGVDIVF